MHSFEWCCYKLEAWLSQEGRCAVCNKPIVAEVEADHIEPYILGGKTNGKNCMVIHKSCHKKIHAEKKQPSRLLTQRRADSGHVPAKLELFSPEAVTASEGEQ